MPDYQGLASIVEYTNADGDLTSTNCGQAAAATLVNFAMPVKNSDGLVRTFEQCFPPNVMFGTLGTSPAQIIRMLDSLKIKVDKIGPNAESCLVAKEPVLLLVGVLWKEFLHLKLREPHWTVAYGYDHDSVYLTNYGKMSCIDFWDGWGDPLVKMVGMAYSGFVVKKVDHA